MKILLDECVPAQQSCMRDRPSERVERHQKWYLLDWAEAEFDLFITSDQNIRYQQNLAGQSIAILELPTNDITRIRAAASILESAVASIEPSILQHLEIP